MPTLLERLAETFWRRNFQAGWHLQVREHHSIDFAVTVVAWREPVDPDSQAIACALLPQKPKESIETMVRKRYDQLQEFRQHLKRADQRRALMQGKDPCY